MKHIVTLIDDQKTMSAQINPAILLGERVLYDDDMDSWKPEATWSAVVVGYMKNMFTIEFDYCVVPEAFRNGQHGPQGRRIIHSYRSQLKRRKREPDDEEKTKQGFLMIAAYEAEKERQTLLRAAKKRIANHENYGHIKVGDPVKWTVDEYQMAGPSIKHFEGTVCAIDANYYFTMELADGSTKIALCTQLETPKK